MTSSILSVAAAQTSGIESIEERLQQQQEERSRAASDSLATPPSGEPLIIAPGEETAGDACLPISSVKVEGAEQLSANALAELTSGLVGPCTAIDEINGALRDITNLYVARGMITTRAVVRQHGLDEGRLTIAVFEGRLEDVSVEGESITTREARLAMPSAAGDLFDLRAVEQAVDQLGRLPSRDVTVDITPGTSPGASILVFKNAPKARGVRAAASFDNLGQASTGELTKSFSLEADRPLRLNDYWLVSASHNEAPDGSSARAASVFAAIPLGRNTLTATGGAFGYDTIVEGNVSTFENAGRSWNAGLRADRLVHRNQAQKWSVGAGLSLTDTQNEIEQVRLLASSYRLAVLEVGTAYQRRTLGAALSAALDYRRGLDVLGAESIEAGETGPQRVFDKVAARASVVRPFEIGGSATRLSLSAIGQWSPDELLPAERFSIGSFGTVRGFQDGGLSGDAGYLIRTQFDADLVENLRPNGSVSRLNAFAAFDYGAIRRDEDAFFERGHLSSVSVGLGATARHVDLAATVSRPLNAPSFLDRPGTQVALSLRLKL